MKTLQDKRWFQIADQLPRPVLRWFGALGALWALGLCDAVGVPLDTFTRGAIFAFVATLYGLRGLEKMKGAI